MRRILSTFIKYGASQRMFLKFFVDPNERLITSMYNMDAVDGKTFMDACIEKMMLVFEGGRFNPFKNLAFKDRTILKKIYQDPGILRIREAYLDFLEQKYSEKLEKIELLRSTTPD